MEGARKADEVGEMRRFLGPDGGALVLTQAGRSPEAPSADESRILALINGVRSVDDVIDASGLDTYTAMRDLFGCARKGWVVPVRRAASGDADSDAPAAFDPAKALRWGVPVALLLALVVFLTNSSSTYHAHDPFVGECLSRAARLQAVESERSVRMAVEAFRVKRGYYPTTLDGLLDEQLVASDVLRDEHGDIWSYAVAVDSSAFALAEALRAPSP